MIHQIIRPRRRPLRRTEINTVSLAHVFDLLPGAREADDGGVEFGEVAVQHGGGVARGVAGYEDGEEGGSWDGGGWLGRGRSDGRRGGGGGGGRGDEIDHPRHLIEFFGADIRAVREPEINLHPRTSIPSAKSPTTPFLNPKPRSLPPYTHHPTPKNPTPPLTNENPPLNAPLPNAPPHISSNSNSPPTFGLPMPLLASATRRRSMRVFSTRK